MRILNWLLFPIRRPYLTSFVVALAITIGVMSWAGYVTIRHHIECAAAGIDPCPPMGEEP